MTTTQIVILIAVLAVIAALVVRRSGPRVTQIDRTIRKGEDANDG